MIKKKCCLMRALWNLSYFLFSSFFSCLLARLFTANLKYFKLKLSTLLSYFDGHFYFKLFPSCTFVVVVIVAITVQRKNVKIDWNYLNWKLILTQNLKLIAKVELQLKQKLKMKNRKNNQNKMRKKRRTNWDQMLLA